MYGGSRMELGAMALLRPLAAPGVMVAVSSRRLQAADRAILVHLGVDLEDVATKATLADAFALALERLGLTVSARRAAVA